MPTLEAIEPRGWKRGRGYSHAIKVDGRVSVAGVLPWDPTTQQIHAADFSSQWATALRNLAELVRSAGSAPDQVTAMRVYVTSLDAYRSAGRALAGPWSETFGSHYPAITLVEVSGLVADGALVEIEAEAVLEGARP